MENIFTQLITAFIGSLGFALLFDLRKNLLLPASLGGLCSWAVYLLCEQHLNQFFMSSLIASAFAALYSEILARAMKAPATLFFVPCVVPLIPGSCLYYTMSYAVQGKWFLSKEYGSQTFLYALAIASGISLVWALEYMLFKTRQNRNAPNM